MSYQFDFDVLSNQIKIIYKITPLLIFSYFNIFLSVLSSLCFKEINFKSQPPHI